MTTVARKAIAVVVFIALVGSLGFLPLAGWLAALVEWAQQHAIAGPLAYIAFAVAATVLFLPGSVTLMIAGFLFGFVPGFLYATVAIPLGALSAFELGRWLARPWVRKQMADKRQMLAIEAALQEQAFLIVLLTRMSLIIPYNLLNYAYGATSVKSMTHLVATTIGMLPAIALYVYLGTLARDVGQILSGDAAPPDLGYWVIGAGAVGIIAVMWIVHRTATRVLEKQLVRQDSTE